MLTSAFLAGPLMLVGQKKEYKAPTNIVLEDRHDVAATSVTVVDDRVAAGFADGTVRVWRIAEASTPPTILKGHRARVSSVAFSPLGDKLISGSDDSTVRIWEMIRLPTRFSTISVLSHDQPVSAVASNRDGLAPQFVTAAGTTVRLWNLNDLTKPQRTFEHESRLYDGTVRFYSVSFTGNYLLAGTDKSVAIGWSTTTMNRRDPIRSSLEL